MKINLKLNRQFAVAAALLGLAGVTNAQTNFYTSEASFLAAVNSPTVDNFTELNSAQNSEPNSLTQSPGNGLSYTISASSGDPLYVWQNQNSSAVSILYTGDTLILSNFVGGATAIGLSLYSPYIGSTADSKTALGNTSTPMLTSAAMSGSMTLEVTYQNGQSATETIANPYGSSMNNLGFFGFTSNSPVASVSFGVTPGSDGLYNLYPMVGQVDLSTTAAAVPEPSSYVLLMAGLAVVGTISRRRSVQAQLN